MQDREAFTSLVFRKVFLALFHGVLGVILKDSIFILVQLSLEIREYFLILQAFTLQFSFGL